MKVVKENTADKTALTEIDFRRAIKGFYRSKRRNLGRSLKGQLQPLVRAINADKVTACGPFGLCARWMVEFYRGEKRIAWISLEPQSDGSLLFRDYSQTSGEYGAKSIGAMNGMNHPTKDITRIDLDDLQKLIIWIEEDETKLP